MFKVELEFDKTLAKEAANSMCDQVDEIFAVEGIPCVESSFGKRVYWCKDCGDIMCGVLSINENKELVSHITKALFFEEGFEPQDLITECFNFADKTSS